MVSGAADDQPSMRNQAADQSDRSHWTDTLANLPIAGLSPYMTSIGDGMIKDLIDKNRAWSAAKTQVDPEFFRRLASQQSPEYLWIGCSDSRVPANEIVGLDPGELFVHRNVANLAPPQDANYLSVLQYAVEVLRVRHIMVVGHYGCGGISAAVDGQRHGLIDHWLHPIRETYDENRLDLEALADGPERLNRLCELSVIRQVRNVASDVFVQDAWDRGQTLSVHGWVYSLNNGLVTDLNVSVSGRVDYQSLVGRQHP
jgi:carbonic anhydrase